MYASATNGYTRTEIRPIRTVVNNGERRTIRIQAGRANTRRDAIRESWNATR